MPRVLVFSFCSAKAKLSSGILKDLYTSFLELSLLDFYYFLLEVGKSVVANVLKVWRVSVYELASSRCSLTKSVVSTFER